MHRRGAGAGDPGIVLARHEAAARPGRQVDNEVGILVANALDDLAVMRELDARSPVRMADVDVRDRRADLGGLQRGIGDLLRRAGQRRILLAGRAIAGDGDAEDGLFRGGHCPLSCND